MLRLVAVLVSKEFKRIRRNVFMLRLIFMIPIVQLLILPFAAEFEMRNIKVCAVDRDNSTASRGLVERIGASQYFNIAGFESSYERAVEGLKRNDYDLVVEIPRDFEKSLTVPPAEDLAAAFNAIDGVKSALGASYLRSVVSDFINSQIRSRADWVAPVRVETEFRYNEHLNYKAYIVPGVIVFILSLIGGLLATLNVVSEKESGTMEQMKVVPLSNYLFLTTKLIPIWIIGMVLLTIGLAMAYAVYGLVPRGGFGLIYGFAAIYLAAFTSFGLLLSSYSDTVQQAMLTFLFFTMIFLLMSGIFTPISSMPGWAQTITLFNPVRYFVEVMRAIYLKGAGFADLRWHFGVICAFAVVLNLAGTFAHRRD